MYRQTWMNYKATFYPPVPFRLFFSQDLHKAASSSKPHTLTKFRIVLIEAVHKITQHQMANVFKGLENQKEQCITKDGACAEI